LGFKVLISGAARSHSGKARLYSPEANEVSAGGFQGL
jgi:hypothetical protein